MKSNRNVGNSAMLVVLASAGVVVIMIVALLALRSGDEGTQATSGEDAAVLRDVGGETAIYSLPTCPVSGEALDANGRPVVKKYDGREVRFCSSDCAATFEADRAAHWSKIDEQVIEQQLMHYSIDTCIISGEALGSRGEPVNYVHKNRLVRFCCDGCIEPFEADPDKHLAALDNRIADGQREDYPLETCPVMRTGLESLGGIVETTYMNRLIRLCCQPCVMTFERNPQTYMPMIDAAYMDAQRDAYALETCPVSGEELGSMGEPHEVMAGDTLVRLCCENCLPELRSDPATYLEKVKSAKSG